MTVEVVPYSADWPQQFAALAEELRAALHGLPTIAVEHIGSTAVAGLAAKPILDLDIIVRREVVAPAITALEVAGYTHRGDLGVTDREAFFAPDDDPARNVYVCVAGTLHVRNHLAVRDALRLDPELRERYGAIKLQLASGPSMDIHRYLAGKSLVLQDVLAASDLTAAEKRQIFELNT